MQFEKEKKDFSPEKGIEELKVCLEYNMIEKAELLMEKYRNPIVKEITKDI